jgi:hypothetical protein
LDLRGLVNKIYEAASGIDSGRKGLAVEGKEPEGRIAYEGGIFLAMTAFKEAQCSVNSQALILAEYTFITQELQLADKSDTDTISSLNKAIASFDDAFLALKAVEDTTMYKGVDLATPHNGQYRVKNGYPNDSFHIACKSHKTRLQNILRSPGINPIEKELLKQRRSNLATAQNAYIEKQKKVLMN